MKKRIIGRLHRVSGQVSALARMIEEQESCDKVIVQFQAAKAALDGAYGQYLEDNISQCVAKNQIEKMRKIVKQMVRR